MNFLDFSVLVKIIYFLKFDNEKRWVPTVWSFFLSTSPGHYTLVRTLGDWDFDYHLYHRPHWLPQFQITKLTSWLWTTPFDSWRKGREKINTCAMLGLKKWSQTMELKYTLFCSHFLSPALLSVSSFPTKHGLNVSFKNLTGISFFIHYIYIHRFYFEYYVNVNQTPPCTDVSRI